MEPIIEETEPRKNILPSPLRLKGGPRPFSPFESPNQKVGAILHKQTPRSERNVQIYIRFRSQPAQLFSDFDLKEFENKKQQIDESCEDCTFSWSIDSENKEIRYLKATKSYTFDHIFTQRVTTLEVYQKCVKSLIDNFLQGFNGTILAYGQTNSGKTHTMFGKPKGEEGIILLGIQDIFSFIKSCSERKGVILKQELKMAFIEIYNEKLIDLLEGIEKENETLGKSPKRSKSSLARLLSSSEGQKTGKPQALVKSKSYNEKGESKREKEKNIHVSLSSKTKRGEEEDSSETPKIEEVEKEKEEEFDMSPSFDATPTPLSPIVLPRAKSANSFGLPAFRNSPRLQLDPSSLFFVASPSSAGSNLSMSGRSTDESKSFFSSSDSAMLDLESSRSRSCSSPSSSSNATFRFPRTEFGATGGVANLSSRTRANVNSNVGTGALPSPKLHSPQKAESALPLTTKKAERNVVRKSQSFSNLKVQTGREKEKEKRKKEDLKIVRKKSGSGFTVLGLTWVPVTESNAVYELIQRGNEKRKFGVSRLNENSSRSHTIVSFEYDVERHVVDKEKKTSGTVRTVSELNLVDLAGSEGLVEKADQKAKSETKNINVSLTHLRSVINALAKEEPEMHISYRNSVLTQVLANSLGGNSKTLLLATASLLPTQDAITKSTLEFAHLAKSMKNNATVGQTRTSGSLKREESLLMMAAAQETAAHHAKELTQSLTYSLHNAESKLATMQEEKDELIKKLGLLEKELKTEREKIKKLQLEIEQLVAQLLLLQENLEEKTNQTIKNAEAARSHEKESKRLQEEQTELKKEVEKKNLEHEKKVRDLSSWYETEKKKILDEAQKAQNSLMAEVEEAQHFLRLMQEQAEADHKKFLEAGGSKDTEFDLLTSSLLELTDKFTKLQEHAMEKEKQKNQEKIEKETLQARIQQIGEAHALQEKEWAKENYLSELKLQNCEKRALEERTLLLREHEAKHTQARSRYKKEKEKSKAVLEATKKGHEAEIEQLRTRINELEKQIEQSAQRIKEMQDAFLLQSEKERDSSHRSIEEVQKKLSSTLEECQKKEISHKNELSQIVLANNNEKSKFESQLKNKELDIQILKNEQQRAREIDTSIHKQEKEQLLIKFQQEVLEQKQKLEKQEEKIKNAFRSYESEKMEWSLQLQALAQKVEESKISKQEKEKEKETPSNAGSGLVSPENSIFQIEKQTWLQVEQKMQEEKTALLQQISSFKLSAEKSVQEFSIAKKKLEDEIKSLNQKLMAFTSSGPLLSSTSAMDKHDLQEQPKNRSLTFQDEIKEQQPPASFSEKPKAQELSKNRSMVVSSPSALTQPKNLKETNQNFQSVEWLRKQLFQANKELSRQKALLFRIKNCRNVNV